MLAWIGSNVLCKVELCRVELCKWNGSATAPSIRSTRDSNSPILSCQLSPISIFRSLTNFARHTSRPIRRTRQISRPNGDYSEARFPLVDCAAMIGCSVDLA
jgi:hypothetical protein